MPLTHQQLAILDALRAKWVQYPTLRLGQLIGNILGASDPYYFKDEMFLHLIQIYNPPHVKDEGGRKGT